MFLSDVADFKPCSGLCVCAAVHCQTLAVCLLIKRGKLLNDVQIRDVANGNLLPMGVKPIWMACAHVPLFFGSYVSAVSLISSRRAVCRGLKGFTEESLGLINAHFLLEILAQTHHRLWIMKWWHSVYPWLKHGHCPVQCLLVQARVCTLWWQLTIS